MRHIALRAVVHSRRSLLLHLLSVMRGWCVCSYEVHPSAAPSWQSCDARGGVGCMLVCAHSCLAQGAAAGSTTCHPAVVTPCHGLLATLVLGTLWQPCGFVGTPGDAHVACPVLSHHQQQLVVNLSCSHTSVLHWALTGQRMRCTLRLMKKPSGGSSCQEMSDRRTLRRQPQAP